MNIKSNGDREEIHYRKDNEIKRTRLKLTAKGTWVEHNFVDPKYKTRTGNKR
jgi:hypothetical protein